MNPFDLHDLDPLSSPDEITERLRDLIEDAAPERRQELRQAWEDLTLHPKKRLTSALSTFVDLEAEVVERPRPARPATDREEGAPALHLRVPITELYATLARDEIFDHEPTGYVTLASDPLLKDNRP